MPMLQNAEAPRPAPCVEGGAGRVTVVPCEAIVGGESLQELAPDRQVRHVRWAFFGIVTKTIREIEKFKDGDRVAGFGFLAPRITCEAENLTRVPPDVPDHVAALLPLSLHALTIVNRLAPANDAPVVVNGLGGLGMLVAMALHQAGFQPVFAVDGREARRELAGRAGIGLLKPPPWNGVPGPKVPEIGEDIPFAVETSGDPQAVMGLLNVLARMGRIVLAGPSRGRTTDVDFYSTVHRRGLTVIGIPDPEAAGAPIADLLKDAAELARSATKLPGLLTKDPLTPYEVEEWKGIEPLLRVRLT